MAKKVIQFSNNSSTKINAIYLNYPVTLNVVNLVKKFLVVVSLTKVSFLHVTKIYRDAKSKTSLRVGFFLDFRNFLFTSYAAKIKKYLFK